MFHEHKQTATEVERGATDLAPNPPVGAGVPHAGRCPRSGPPIRLMHQATRR